MPAGDRSGAAWEGVVLVVGLAVVAVVGGVGAGWWCGGGWSAVEGVQERWWVLVGLWWWVGVAGVLAGQVAAGAQAAGVSVVVVPPSR
ncbi:hypothetical protein BJF81_01565 [Ornithinimicrobium sp. CNJ-824]|nr:hypothetical protein BJF81_01565 [Ornithinimicrobium sp. CNJ-824]